MKDKENKKRSGSGDVNEISGLILYEDDHLLAVDKPFGMPTQKDRTGDISLHEAAGDYIRERDGIKDPFLRLVHRLDRPVGGVILFARTPTAARRLSETFRERGAKKIYLARIEGVVEPPTGVLIHSLLKSGSKATVVPEGTPRSKRALLNYRTLGCDEKADESLVEIDLITGRKHQIRAQLSHAGCPVCGDIKYGSKRKFVPGAIALFSVSLTFPHPATGEEMTVLADPPEELLSPFKGVLERSD